MRLPRDWSGAELAKRIGTLNKILTDVALNEQVDKNELLEKLGA